MKDLAINATRMKENNQKRVLAEARNKILTRSDLARATGLTRSAISLIVDSLLKDSTLMESQSPEAKGRITTLLQWNPNAYCVAGIYLTRSHISVGLLDMCGNLYDCAMIKPSSYATANQAVERIAGELWRIIGANIGAGRLLGIGVTAPGPLNTLEGRILRPPNFETFFDFPIVDALKDKFGCAVLLENDSNAFALAERAFNDAIGAGDSFLLVTVNEGIGGGMIWDGHLIKGKTGLGGELGHVSIRHDGPKCNCGNYGCVELYASVPNILKSARSLDPELICWNCVVDAANDCRESALAVMKNEAEYLATVIVSALNIFDFQLVVLTGDITYRPKVLLDLIKQKVNERSFMNYTRCTARIEMSTLPAHAGVLASGNLVIEDFLAT